MEKSKPMELGLGELLSNQNIVNNNSFRFINRDLGIVVSFAQMDSILFSTGKPYRTRESRIIRILRGEARISINLIEYKVKEPMIIISPCNSLIEIIEISEDYDFQVIVPDNNFLPGCTQMVEKVAGRCTDGFVHKAWHFHFAHRGRITANRCFLFNDMGRCAQSAIPPGSGTTLDYGITL